MFCISSSISLYRSKRRDIFIYATQTGAAKNTNHIFITGIWHMNIFCLQRCVGNQINCKYEDLREFGEG